MQRQIPGRERLKTYPVCRWHSAMIDVGNAAGDAADLPDDFVRTSTRLIEEAEAITRRESNRRGSGPDPDGDPGAG